MPEPLYLVQVGECWLRTRKRRNSSSRHLLETDERSRAERFPLELATRAADVIRHREEILSRAGIRAPRSITLQES
jgi:hypothetical protein